MSFKYTQRGKDKEFNKIYICIKKIKSQKNFSKRYNFLQFICPATKIDIFIKFYEMKQKKK